MIENLNDILIVLATIWFSWHVGTDVIAPMYTLFKNKFKSK